MMDEILNMDCNKGLELVPDKSVDLIIMDPPYEMDTCGGGAFGSFNKLYHGELNPISNGISNDTLDVLVKKMKAVNIYVWCNKNQLRQYFDYFGDRGCNIDLLTWHKTNPVPACGNKYLSDTEYLVFARAPGVKLYGTYESKKKWYVSPLNTNDKEQWQHPTVKPLNIIKNLILNSSLEGDVVMDPFMGSGTTAVAAIQMNRHYLGFEINETFYKIANERIKQGTQTWF